MTTADDLQELADGLSAKEISKIFLERTGSAAFSNDFETFSKCFHLPQEIGSFEGLRTIETLDELREVFDGTRSYIRQMGITQTIRHCIEANFRDVDTIAATHETRLLIGQTMAQPPYVAFSILKKFSDGWKITFSQYAVEKRQDQISRFSTSPTKPTSKLK